MENRKWEGGEKKREEKRKVESERVREYLKV